MKTTPRSESEVRRLAQRKPMPPGWRDAKIISAMERPSRKGNETIELALLVVDSEGNERELKDWLSNTTLGSQKLRHCCDACGDRVFAKYEAGEIGQGDFPGHTVRVHISIDKPRGQSPHNAITDYARVSVAAAA